MATLVLAAAGTAIGSSFGGTFLGLSGAVIGRAVGATIGQVIDQRLASGGSEVVEQARVERLHLMGASEGTAIPLVWGRMRVAGQVIWATRFVERVTRRETGRGKGGGRGASTTVEEFSYSVSLAVALCEGEVARLGRVWADGIEVDPEALPLRFYSGSETQLPDPKIAAVEGAEAAPAYRGTAYVVLEDLALAPYGNRVPQFSFEVFRTAQGPLAQAEGTLVQAVRAVALLPGTGEYSLATTPVHYDYGLGKTRTANRHATGRATNFSVSMRQLREELPACTSVSVVVSWFGNDLRLGQCQVRPKVEQTQFDGAGMPWRAGGIGRGAAALVPQVEGRPVYGGTPADAAVVEALRDIRARGQKAMFYPFVLMEQLDGNGLPDPWTGAANQPVLPWRGRITLSVAPGRAGSPDRTAAAAQEVAAFFGTATPAQVLIEGGQVVHDGVADWGYRRFILHYARLCQLAGGIDAFCIGSELRGITQIRGAGDSFPAVDALRQLVADVRAILGPGVKISYAADWSEYWGHAADGNRYFHLDPFWADPNVDFVGIDNYMPLSDWRSGQDHADAGWGSIYALDYLKANVAGGEGFDWYYDSVEGAEAQRRLPITDGVADEAWIWRYKDLKSWWSLAHHERIGGVRSALPTGWVPRSKPFWFTEYGCPAVDRGTNQPNLFLDARSSESALPRGSTGARDDLIQMQYLRAFADHFADPANNPPSPLYGGSMVDMSRAHVWAWDARPFPQFPALLDVWSDGDSYRRGHWLNGRASAVPLAAVIGEIAGRAGLAEIGTERLYGLVRGYEVARIATARAAIQPLSLAFGFDAAERGGRVEFSSRTGVAGAEIDPALLVEGEEADLSRQRASAVERADEMRVTHVEGTGDYQARVASARSEGGGGGGVSEAELALLLTDAEARGIAERWIAEAEVARDVARFALPPSRLDLGSGDVVRIGGQSFRIDSVEIAEAQIIEAVRTEAGVYALPDRPERPAGLVAATAAGPVDARFLDLPLLTGAENPVAPHVAVAADPWNGGTAVWASDGADGYRIAARVEVPSILGVTESPLAAARAGLWDRAGVLRLRLSQPEISSAPLSSVLNGANLAAIGPVGVGDWEVFQFAEAVPVAAQTWELRGLLRGQCGTDGIMPASWPAGSSFVLLDGSQPQLRLSAEEVGLSRRYRIGAAVAGPDAPGVIMAERGFAGIGQRPYPVAHLRAVADVAGTRFSWVRRTRIGGDSWQGIEVPLGEAREAYVFRIRQGGDILREVETAVPGLLYTTAMKMADQATSGWRVEVAQLSDAFGPGPFRSLQVG